MLVKSCFVSLSRSVFLIHYVTKPVVAAEMIMHISEQLQYDTLLFIIWYSSMVSEELYSSKKNLLF